jgi:hypothetical protein
MGVHWPGEKWSLLGPSPIDPGRCGLRASAEQQVDEHRERGQRQRAAPAADSTLGPVAARMIATIVPGIATATATRSPCVNGGRFDETCTSPSWARGWVLDAMSPDYPHPRRENRDQRRVQLPPH